MSQTHNVPNSIAKYFLEIKPKLINLIDNYKKRVFSSDPELTNIKNRILYDLKTEFLISLILGRLLHIISNNNIINKKTSTLEVTMNLGKEITNKYILQCFNLYKLTNSNNLSFSNWKLENPNLIN